MSVGGAGDVAVIGAGRIGVPWSAVLAAELDYSVTCIDVDRERVDQINRGEAPFAEPDLPAYMERATESGNLTATTDETAVEDHDYVAFTVNARRNRMARFVDVVRQYAPYLTDDHVVINRVTLPVDMIGTMRETIAEAASGDPTFTVLPERLAEGKAIREIHELPKIVGAADGAGRAAITDLLAGLDCELRFTDPETAMFVKLIDNTYRDALFAIANQIAYTSDELGLNAHEAIDLANYDYPRNDIPSPGTVGGKCLPKDPHFLTDERVCDQPTTPDLFNSTRRTNAYLPSYVATKLLRHQPDQVAMLGLTYKPGVGDTYNSPAMDVKERLESQGVRVEGTDPNVPGAVESVEEVLSGADVVVLAVNHPEYEGVEAAINEYARPEAVVYDVWGHLDASRIDRPYEGFGIAESPRNPVPEPGE